MAYVRDAKPEEFENAALVYARAFINDPIMYWMGSVSKQITLPPGQSITRDTFATLPKHIKTLFYLHHSLCITTRLVGGRVLVTVRPEENGKEKIVSVTLWVPAQAKVDGLVTVTRAKQYRSIFGTLENPGGWGLVGLKRVVFSYEKRIEKLQKNILKSRGIDHSRAWHLLDVATDPAEEGKGYCGKLVRHGLKEVVQGAPVFLESTTPRSRNLYSHLGFEITDTPMFGTGTVTEFGLPPVKGHEESATGVPVWTMLYSKGINP